MSSRRDSFFSVLGYRSKNPNSSKDNSKGPDNPYLKTLSEQTMILRDTVSSIHDRTLASERIAYCIYIGGAIIEPYLKKDSLIIDVILSILMEESENLELKLVIYFKNQKS